MIQKISCESDRVTLLALNTFNSLQTSRLCKTMSINWEEHLDFLDKGSYVDLSNIPEENVVCPFGLDDFQKMFDEEDAEHKDDEDNRRKERILVGLNDPFLEMPMMTMTVTKTKIIKKTLIKKEIVKEPEPKKQKTSDWRSGHNKPLETSTNNKVCQTTKKKKQSEEDIFIPIGCESMFDAETGSLVQELQDLDPRFVAQIGSELLQKIDDLGFDKIAGLKLQKKKIKEIGMLLHSMRYGMIWHVNSYMAVETKGFIWENKQFSSETSKRIVTIWTARYSFFYILFIQHKQYANK